MFSLKTPNMSQNPLKLGFGQKFTDSNAKKNTLFDSPDNLKVPFYMKKVSKSNDKDWDQI